MSYKAFKDALTSDVPPAGISVLQQGLWYAAKGNWEAAHQVAQDHEGERDFDRLHAYLHRVEGDEWNAGYWYRRAGAAVPVQSLEEELESLIQRWG
ncbi:hypothetical protein LQ567_20360 [Niabella pedocola]|uniref:Uncharacterized protein n=1 Tax=Niabella pedocola TaxID=1752077 RepID=A0ABS8PVQ7_9BACT|nr:hypothetical protein [Niabella pedocola]MCD2425150.1 hypothetical protein [Niabella pedocola]